MNPTAIIAKIFKNPWTWVVIFAVAALLLWKYRGPIVSIFKPAPLPTQGSTGVQLTDEEARMIRSLSNRLWTDIDKWNNPWWGSRDTESWNELLQLSDPLFLAVFNDFGNLYYSNDGKTLADYVAEENFAITSSIFTPWSIYNGSTIKDALIERFGNLNLA